MKGLSHTYYQIYAYQNLEYSNKLINIDGYMNCTRDEKNQLIIYKFPLNKCIRLDFLLKSLKLFRIHLAQLLLIIREILVHLQKLENNATIHPNLSINKIWIVLNDGSEQFNIKYSKLSYKIHFVGYETNDIIDLNEYENVIKDIINQMGNIKLKNKQNKYLDQILKQKSSNSMIQIDSKLTQSLFIDIFNIIDKPYQQAIQQIDQILSKKEYKYNSKLQLFEIIDKDSVSYKRSRKKVNVIEYLEALYGMQQKEDVNLNNQTNLQTDDLSQLQIDQIKNLQFEDRFYKSVSYLIEKLKKQIWKEDNIWYPNANFDIKEIQNMRSKYIADLSQYSANIIISLDNIQQQDFKFKSNINEDEVIQLVIKIANQQFYPNLNSLESITQIFNHNYYNSILNKLKKNIKTEILLMHKQKFIEQIDQLIKSLN